MHLITVDVANQSGWAVATVKADEMPAFVSAVAGMCGAMALDIQADECLEVGNTTFQARCFTVQEESTGAWHWQAELYRVQALSRHTYSLFFPDRADAEALRHRLAEVAEVAI